MPDPWYRWCRGLGTASRPLPSDLPLIRQCRTVRLLASQGFIVSCNTKYEDTAVNSQGVAPKFRSRRAHFGFVRTTLSSRPQVLVILLQSRRRKLCRNAFLGSGESPEGVPNGTPSIERHRDEVGGSGSAPRAAARTAPWADAGGAAVEAGLRGRGTRELDRRRF